MDLYTEEKIRGLWYLQIVESHGRNQIKKKLKHLRSDNGRE